MSEEHKCSDCKHFERYTDDSMTGQCRRFPPQIKYIHNYGGEREFSSRFPEVCEDDWCGGFEPKDE